MRRIHDTVRHTHIWQKHMQTMRNDRMHGECAIISKYQFSTEELQR
jgi:hypothetical protein